MTCNYFSNAAPCVYQNVNASIITGCMFAPRMSEPSSCQSHLKIKSQISRQLDNRSDSQYSLSWQLLCSLHQSQCQCNAPNRRSIFFISWNGTKRHKWVELCVWLPPPLHPLGLIHWWLIEGSNANWSYFLTFAPPTKCPWWRLQPTNRLALWKLNSDQFWIPSQGTYFKALKASTPYYTFLDHSHQNRRSWTRTCLRKVSRFCFKLIMQHNTKIK